MNVLFNEADVSYLGALSLEIVSRVFDQLFRDRRARGDAEPFDSVQPCGIDRVMIIYEIRGFALRSSHFAELV